MPGQQSVPKSLMDTDSNNTTGQQSVPTSLMDTDSNNTSLEGFKRLM